MDPPDAPSSSPPKSRRSSRSSSIGGGISSSEYISLRDVLVDGGNGNVGGGSWREYSCQDIHEFDASNIGIRNHLLKHAASAYLQSAVVVAPREQGWCLARLWRRLRWNNGGGRGRGRVLMRACSWHGCVDDPAELLASFLARSARRLAAFLAGIWA
uniref:Uncharacterized protein n=1 Tax=Leersia perrieri TaxID=77586 RepID=A0A0D9Y1H0_9ORYZ